MNYSLTEKILLFLANSADLGEFLTHRNSLAALFKGIPYPHKEWQWLKKYLDNKRKRKKIYSLIAGLKRRGYLQKKIFRNSCGYMLTPKAEMKLLIMKAREARSSGNKSTGQQLMVFYDIPEKLRSARERFRKILKELGFEQLQKSIWISSYDVFKETKNFIREMELDEYVQLLSVKPLADKRIFYNKI